MARSPKTWMSGLVLLALIAASVAPASALTISFTTAAAPLTIVSSTIAQNQTGVNGSSVGEFWRVTFSQDITSPGPGWWQLYTSDGALVSNVTESGGAIAPGINYLALSLTQPNQLTPGAQYYVQFMFVDNNGVGLDPSDPANSPYLYDANSNHGIYRIHFTTAALPVWGTQTVSNASGAYGALTNGQTGVAINAKIKVKASAALDAATVNATNVLLYKDSVGGSAVAVGVSLDTDNETVIVSPAANLAYSTTYYLVLAGVKDASGQTLP